MGGGKSGIRRRSYRRPAAQIGAPLLLLRMTKEERRGDLQMKCNGQERRETDLGKKREEEKRSFGKEDEEIKMRERERERERKSGKEEGPEEGVSVGSPELQLGIRRFSLCLVCVSV